MQRQRGELVPIGEVVADLPGPVQAFREAEQPARRGFTVADQVNQLVWASEAAPDRGFMARMMALLCSLPRTNPRDRLRYVRRNGPYTLVMNAGGLYKLPFGHLPRLLLAWISTEAVRTQSRVLVLGDSLSDFMRELGIYSSDGKAYTRLRNQMERLFNASVRLTYEDKHGKQFVSSAIADRGEFWWDPKRLIGRLALHHPSTRGSNLLCRMGWDDRGRNLLPLPNEHDLQRAVPAPDAAAKSHATGCREESYKQAEGSPVTGVQHLILPSHLTSFGSRTSQS